MQTQGQGIYTLLPRTKNILNQLTKTFKTNLCKVGGTELLMPCTSPSKTFNRRLKHINNIFKLKDNQTILVPTAEEIAITLFGFNKPKILFQIQSKFRNELRPNHKLIKSFEFLMLDCYINCKDKITLSKTFRKVMNIFDNCLSKINITTIVSVSEVMEMGGKYSFELILPTEYTTSAKCLVSPRSLKVQKQTHQLLSFTKEYIHTNKVILDRNYLLLTGIEIAHAFIFDKLRKN